MDAPIENLDLIATLSTEEDLMEGVLLFLGVSSLLNIELASKIFRSHMEKTLTWKKKLKQVFPEYFTNRLSDCVKERLSRFTAKPDSHEKFKAILLSLFKLNENWKSGNHNLTKVNVSAVSPSSQWGNFTRYQWEQSVLDSKCVLKSGERGRKAWFTEDLEHPYPMRKSSEEHKVGTLNGFKDCYCLEDKIQFEDGKLVSITSNYIYIWKNEELVVFRKSNFEYLKSLDVPINENTFDPVRLNAIGKFFHFFFISDMDRPDVFVDLFERQNDEVPDILGPRILRCKISVEASFENYVLDMLKNSEFDENHMISVVKSPYRVCVWNFSPTRPEQKDENHEENAAQQNLLIEDDQEDNLFFPSDASDQSDEDLDEEEDEDVEYDGRASLIWSVDRDENIFPRPTYTSLAIRYPLAYIGMSNSKCEVWNVEENLRLSILYLGEAPDGTVMSVRQIFPVGHFILTTSSGGWLLAFHKKAAEEISESYIEPLWKKTNSGNGRQFVKIYADETKVVSVQLKGELSIRPQIYVVVQDFWGKVEKKNKDRSDLDLGEGCSTSVVKVNGHGKSKAKIKHLTQIDDEDSDDPVELKKTKDNTKKRRLSSEEVSVIEIDDDARVKDTKKKITRRDIPVIQIDEDDIDDDHDDYNYAEEDEYIY